MKKSLFTAFAVGLGLTAKLMAQVPSYVPTNGLVGWWPFNGNANDESGNGNNGSVTGATLTTDRFGNVNSSYNFNVGNWTWGANGDFIYIPYNPTFNFSEFTVSAWVNLASDGSTLGPQGLTVINRFEYGYNNPNGESWGLSIGHGSSADGALVYGGVVEQSPSPAPTSSCSSTQTISINEWKNILMSYSQSTLKIYIDGIIACSTTDPSIILNTIGNSGISIGLSVQANGHWGPYDGKIDDIAIWNRALTQQEITDLYNATNLGMDNLLGEDLKIYPNPTNDYITIDAGNLSSTIDYRIKIEDVHGQEVFQSAINQQQFYVDLSTWSGNGLYFVHLIDPQNNTVTVRKIVLQ
jgi:hypothetical protein